MKQPIHNLSKKYFYFLCCFFLLINNASAVKSVINPVQKMEVKSDSIPSELIFMHRSDQRPPKSIREGQKVKIRTKNKKTYRGRLKVIDEDYIEVGGQKIALENIVRVKHRNKRRKMVFGFGFLAALAILGIISFLLMRINNRDTYILGIIIGILAVILSPIGLLALLLPVFYSSRAWKISTSKEDKVLYRRNDS